MDQTDLRIAHPHEASTDERAFLLNPGAGGPEPPCFASAAEERAWWAGVRFGRSHGDSYFSPPPGENFTPRREEVTVPTSASAGDIYFSPPVGESFIPRLEEVTVPTSTADPLERIPDTVDASFPPGGRKPRHDGFTPEAMGAFLRDLAAHGVVAHAAAAAGVSAAAAYAYRNRRQGRAFAAMWDAILVHRARARLAAENQAAATLGCVSRRYDRNGELAGEYHYRDNRLAMAMLTRLERLAEREAPREDHLRALSEDLEEFIDCAAAGGDLDAFVAARRPAEPEGDFGPDAEPPPRPDSDPELTEIAALAGLPDYREVHPCDIDVSDLDPTRRDKWGLDGWIRGFRSGLVLWLENSRPDGMNWQLEGPPLRFIMLRAASGAAVDAEAACVAADEPCPGAGHGPSNPNPAIDTSDLDPAGLLDWSEDQLARAWWSGLIGGFDWNFWDSYWPAHLARAAAAAGEAGSAPLAMSQLRQLFCAARSRAGPGVRAPLGAGQPSSSLAA